MKWVEGKKENTDKKEKGLFGFILDLVLEYLGIRKKFVASS